MRAGQGEGCLAERDVWVVVDEMDIAPPLITSEAGVDFLSGLLTDVRRCSESFAIGNSEGPLWKRALGDRCLAEVATIHVRAWKHV